MQCDVELSMPSHRSVLTEDRRRNVRDLCRRRAKMDSYVYEAFEIFGLSSVAQPPRDELAREAAVGRGPSDDSIWTDLHYPRNTGHVTVTARWRL